MTSYIQAAEVFQGLKCGSNSPGVLHKFCEGQILKGVGALATKACLLQPASRILHEWNSLSLYLRLIGHGIRMTSLIVVQNGASIVFDFQIKSGHD